MKKLIFIAFIAFAIVANAFSYNIYISGDAERSGTLHAGHILVTVTSQGTGAFASSYINYDYIEAYATGHRIDKLYTQYGDMWIPYFIMTRKGYMGLTTATANIDYY